MSFARRTSGTTTRIDNGRVFTPAGVIAGSVLVEDGLVTALGEEARDRPATTVIDAGGGSVLPGFQDCHVHPVHAGLDMLTCDLTDHTTVGGYLEAISAYAASTEESWIVGGGWSMDSFPGGRPDAATLDSVVPDRPAYFPSRDGHSGWVNSRALELAGIDASTPDPADGRIERLADGSPSGALQEGAMQLVAALIPPASDADLDAALLLAHDRLLAWGVTGWQDAIVGATNDVPDFLDSYLRHDASGALRASVVGALWWDRSRGLEQIDELVERRERSRAAGRFRATSVKIMQDGVAENFTAGMLEPYLDECGCPTHNTGKSFVDPTLLREIVSRLDALDFQVHIHALGDRAVREALDAIGDARAANGDTDRRHTLAHIQVVHPDDVPRFAELGVVANMQPLWARHEPQMDELTSPFLGARRAAWQYPFGSLGRAGAVLASGSDWPVSTADPLEIVHSAVNRARHGATGDAAAPFLGEQALSLADALIAHTHGTAFLNHDDGRSGTIERGKVGDLVVLDRDITALPVAEIGGANVDVTLIEGDVVYTRGS
jgi:predicted amidohydrolase YtcJ